MKINLRNAMLSRVQRKADAQYNLEREDYTKKMASVGTTKIGISEMDEPISPPIRKITKFFTRG